MASPSSAGQSLSVTTLTSGSSGQTYVIDWTIQNVWRQSDSNYQNFGRITSPVTKSPDQFSTAWWIRLKFEKLPLPEYEWHYDAYFPSHSFELAVLSSTKVTKATFNCTLKSPECPDRWTKEYETELGGKGDGSHGRMDRGHFLPEVVQVTNLIKEEGEFPFLELPNGGLTVRLHISVKEFSDSTGKLVPPVYTSTAATPDPIGVSLYATMDLSDVILSTGHKEFKAHKLILSARSGEFRALFNQEKITKINMNRYEPAIVQEMLRFLYTNKVENLKNMAGKLLSLAYEYKIEDLKKLCVAELLPGVSVENAFAALQLGGKLPSSAT